MRSCCNRTASSAEMYGSLAAGFCPLLGLGLPFALAAAAAGAGAAAGLPARSSGAGSAGCGGSLSRSRPMTSTHRREPRRSVSSKPEKAPPARLTSLARLAASGLPRAPARASFTWPMVTLLMTVNRTSSSSSTACRTVTSTSVGGSSSGWSHLSRDATKISFLTHSESLIVPKEPLPILMRNFTCFILCSLSPTRHASFSLSSETSTSDIISSFSVAGLSSPICTSVTSIGSGGGGGGFSGSLGFSGFTIAGSALACLM
mmetsp:Transcript_45067/g.139438  ORF Transcript_45067/g.139438 Transcript_45067/m.139438 type:complete len:260 (+) Transcript_45067:670-1449(+)